MSKFNKIIKEQSVTVNHEGAEAFRLSAEMELYTAVVTASLSSKFYETADERIERIADLVGKCNARFVATYQNESAFCSPTSRGGISEAS